MYSSNKYKGKLGKTLLVLSIVPSILVYGAVSSSASGPKSVNPEHPVITSTTTKSPVVPSIIDCNITSSPVSTATPMTTPSTSDSSTPVPLVSLAPTNNHDSGIENGCDIPEPIACNSGAVSGSPGPLATPTDAPSVSPSVDPSTAPVTGATPNDVPTPGANPLQDQNGRGSGECLPPPPGCVINPAPPIAGHPIIQKGLPTVSPSSSPVPQKGKSHPIIQKGSPKGKTVKPSINSSSKSSEKPLNLPPFKPTLSPLPKPSISGGSQGSNEDNGSKCEPHNPGGPVESQGGKGEPNPQASQNGNGSSDRGLGAPSCVPSSSLKGSGKLNQPQAPQPQSTSVIDGSCPPPPPPGDGPIHP